jgi:hypothetical protein
MGGNQSESSSGFRDSRYSNCDGPKKQPHWEVKTYIESTHMKEPSPLATVGSLLVAPIILAIGAGYVAHKAAAVVPMAVSYCLTSSNYQPASNNSFKNI